MTLIKKEISQPKPNDLFIEETTKNPSGKVSKRRLLTFVCESEGRYHFVDDFGNPTKIVKDNFPDYVTYYFVIKYIPVEPLKIIES